MSAPTERERYIDGLRILAAALEAHPDIPLPTHGTISPVSICFLHGGSERDRMAEAARALPCAWRKEVRDGGEYGDYFDLAGQIGGLRLKLVAYRDTVCRRVVTGTREVTETVRDPEKLAEVPEVEMTRTEDIVEWDCGTLLGPRSIGEGEPAAVAS